MENSRKEFEEHTRSIMGFEESCLEKYPDGRYREPLVGAAWQGWQAGRDPKYTRQELADIIKKHCGYSDEHDKYEVVSISTAINALIDAGALEVKKC